MSSPGDRSLTTTSYAILGLLAIRPWSTYELAKQMRRSLHHVWPRAESNVYAEPKRLVEAGLAHAEAQQVGARPRTLYSITDEGRRALERWLSAQNAPPRYESEAHLKVLFGDYGTKDELLANLHAIAAEAGAVKALWRTIASEYVGGKRPFPGRVHVNSLIYRWVWEQQELHERWARWAIERVESWPDVHGPADDAQSLAVFRDALKSPPGSE